MIIKFKLVCKILYHYGAGLIPLHILAFYQRCPVVNILRLMKMMVMKVY